MLAVIFINSLFNAYGQLAMAFMMPPNVEFHCARTEEAIRNNITIEDWRRLTHNESMKEGSGHCIRHFFDHSTFTTREHVIACDRWVFDHSVHHSTILEEWDLVCDNDYLKPFPQSLSMAGLIIGNVVFSHFSDHYGRRPAVFAGMLICAVSGVMATATSNFALFNIGRFFSSVSKIGIQASIVVYLESIDPHYRYLFSLLNGFGFHLGMLFVALTAFFGNSWRYLQGLISGPAVAILPFLFFVYESPRWLLSQRRPDEAESVLRDICAWNNVPTERVNELLPKIRTKYAHLKQGKSKNALDLFRDSNGTNPTRNTLLMWYLCFTSGILFYASTFMSTELEIGLGPHVSFCLPIGAELVAILLVSLGVRYLRRKAIIFTTSLLGALGFYLMGFGENLGVPSWIIDLVAIIMIRASSAAFTQIYPVYSAELYPTPLRNVGIGFCDLMYRLASTIDPFGRYWLPRFHTHLLPGLYGTMSLVACVFCLFLPETLNKALDDGVFARLSRTMSSFRGSIRRSSKTSMGTDRRPPDAV
ncbi:organic cation transporter protein-like [Tropilaelaps mercedesae]|uniref:Organic cation transporter protein-like n=1 Tax=Tropilaelaps mercedesae TaxID=418985 RepID=A0A1V9XL34_9ACAR|nr:organic cation transporter protein-like [Tropilaelaps mercedesae]